MLMQFQSYAHAWTHYQAACFFGYKYDAYAQCAALSYTYCPTRADCNGNTLPYVTANWTKKDPHSAHGCSRPQFAFSVFGSSAIQDYTIGCGFVNVFGAFKGFASCLADYYIGGIEVWQWTAGRGAAGYNDTLSLDSTILAGLDTSGFSQDTIRGEDTIDAENNLVISNLHGNIAIANNSNFYADVQVIVVVQDTTDHTDTLEQAAQNGIFKNSVYTAEIYVSKGNITTTGFFSTLNQNQLTPINNGGLYGLNLNNISTTVPINVSLSPTQYLAVYTVVDGAFDLSSAVIKNGNKSSSIGVNHYKELKDAVEIYPNPAINILNCTINVPTDNENISIRAFNLAGKDIGEIYSGTFNHGVAQLQNIDVSHLPQGINILEVKVGDKTTYRKITINR